MYKKLQGGGQIDPPPSGNRVKEFQELNISLLLVAFNHLICESKYW